MESNLKLIFCSANWNKVNPVFLHGKSGISFASILRTGLKYLIQPFYNCPTMGKVDCLFLHVPKLINYYRPIGQFIWINFLPMGLLALADLLHRHGILD